MTDLMCAAHSCPSEMVPALIIACHCSVVHLSPVHVYVSADCSAPMHVFVLQCHTRSPRRGSPCHTAATDAKMDTTAQEVTSSCVTATQGDWSVVASMAAVRSALQSRLASHLGLAPPRLVLLLQVVLPAWQLKSQPVGCLASAAGLSGF